MDTVQFGVQVFGASVRQIPDRERQVALNHRIRRGKVADRSVAGLFGRIYSTYVVLSRRRPCLARFPAQACI